METENAMDKASRGKGRLVRPLRNAQPLTDDGLSDNPPGVEQDAKSVTCIENGTW